MRSLGYMAYDSTIDFRLEIYVGRMATKNHFISDFLARGFRTFDTKSTSRTVCRVSIGIVYSGDDS